MHCGGHIRVFPCAIMARNGYAYANGKPHEQVDDQIDEGACGTHCRKRSAPGIPAYNNNIRSVEQQLQHT